MARFLAFERPNAWVRTPISSVWTHSNKVFKEPMKIWYYCLVADYLRRARQERSPSRLVDDGTFPSLIHLWTAILWRGERAGLLFLRFVSFLLTQKHIYSVLLIHLQNIIKIY